MPENETPITQSPISKIKKIVADHKVAIAVTTTAIATAVVAKKVYGKAYGVADEFITEKGLAEEFLEYIPLKNR